MASSSSPSSPPSSAPAYAITVGPFAQPFAVVHETTLAAFKAEGFGLITNIDFQATMKAKLDIDMPPCTVLGLCNPKLAYEVVMAEPTAAALLPCRVSVRETADGEVFIDLPDMMGTMVDSMATAKAREVLRNDATPRVERALAAIKGKLGIAE